MCSIFLFLEIPSASFITWLKSVASYFLCICLSLAKWISCFGFYLVLYWLLMDNSTRRCLEKLLSRQCILNVMFVMVNYFHLSQVPSEHNFLLFSFPCTFCKSSWNIWLVNFLHQKKSNEKHVTSWDLAILFIESGYLSLTRM